MYIVYSNKNNQLEIRKCKYRFRQGFKFFKNNPMIFTILSEDKLPIVNPESVPFKHFDEINDNQFKIIWQYQNLTDEWETLDYIPKHIITLRHPELYRKAAMLI